MWVAAVATVGAAALACGGEPTASGVPEARLGIYVLDSLDGAPLPGTAAWNSIPQTILADTLELRADQTFELWAITDGPILGFSGPTTVRGDSLFLRDPILGGVSAAGEFAGSGVRLSSFTGHPFPGHVWWYRKAP